MPQQQEAKQHLIDWKVGALFMEAGTGKTRVACELVNSVPGIDLVIWVGVKLEDLGVEDKEICNAMGVEPEELIRLKNQLGISVSFKNVEYANSWEIDEGR